MTYFSLLQRSLVISWMFHKGAVFHSYLHIETVTMCFPNENVTVCIPIQVMLLLILKPN